MVHLLKPQPGEVVRDPAAGTAGFLIAAPATTGPAAPSRALAVLRAVTGSSGFSSLATLPFGALFNAVVAPSSEYLLVIGGRDNEQVFRSDIVMVDVGLGRAFPLGDLASPRWMFSTTELADGRVLVMGGSNPYLQTTVEVLYLPQEP